jgi:hypothetical protein
MGTVSSLRPDALLPGKEPPVSTGCDAQWAPEQGSGNCGLEQISAAVGNLIPGQQFVIITDKAISYPVTQCKAQ